MKFDTQGQAILNHSLCLKCQFNTGEPFICSSCQWSLVMNWISEKEEKNREYILEVKSQ